MKKVSTLCLGTLVLLSSCGTATGTGAIVGGQFGHVIGSAIGGISGGWRGHDVGSLIGTVGGAVAGAAIGAAVDNAQQKKMEEYYAQRQQQRRQLQRDEAYGSNDAYGSDDSGFDPQGRGDDRISFDDGGATARDRAHYSLSPVHDVEPTPANIASMDGVRASTLPALQIRRVRVVDDNRDMVLSRNEECKIQFEIMNNSGRTVYDIQPTVVELTGNKHVQISPNINVESIPAGSGVRYTATILADGRLKDGEVRIRIGVLAGNREVASQIKELVIPTRKLRR